MSMKTKLPPSRSLSLALESVTDAVLQIDEFFAVFGGHWPPRPSFDWPACFHGYHEIWEMAVEKSVEISHPGTFRKWMKCELRKRINLHAVLEELRPRLWLHDPVMLGLQGCLQFNVSFYRWGACPQTAEERQRESLEFPEELWTPFTMIAVLVGVPAGSSLFNLAFAAADYDDEGKTPVSMHYHWSNEPKLRASENQFFLSFVRLDTSCKPCLTIIREYLVYTHAASLDKFKAKALLDPRVALLKDLRDTFLELTQDFAGELLTQGEVSIDDFNTHVLGMASWDLAGREGVSGRELLCFSLFYAFLATPTDTIGGYGIPEQRNLPSRCRQLLEVLAEDERDKRFDSFLGLSAETDPLLGAREELVQSLYMWGLGQEGEYDTCTQVKVPPTWSDRARDGIHRCGYSIQSMVRYILNKLCSCVPVAAY